MVETVLSSKPIAVLIDAENVQQPDLMEGLLARLARHGTVGLKRAYGNAVAIEKWKPVAIEFGIQPLLQFNPNDKGNATDFALTIDAMDLLHSGRFGAFCIVSSDSDFMPLAMRIRAEGVPVYGCGVSDKTVETRKVYDDFFDLDTWVKPRNKVAKEKRKTSSPKGRKPIPSKLFLRIVKSLADADGHSPFREVEAKIKKSRPDLSPMTYGYASIREMFEESDAFDFVPKRGKRGAYVKLP